MEMEPASRMLLAALLHQADQWEICEVSGYLMAAALARIDGHQATGRVTDRRVKPKWLLLRPVTVLKSPLRVFSS